MEKMMAMRSLYRSLSSRSYAMAAVNHQLLRHYCGGRSLFNLPSPPAFSTSPNNTLASSDFRSSFSMGLGSRRFYSEDHVHTPSIADPDLERAFKDLMATSWDHLPNHVIHDAKAALSKNTEDKAGKEVVENVFRAAEAVEEFSGMLLNLKMELDDTIGMSGENVKPLSDDHVKALHTIFDRYTAYLGAFGPNEAYLQKKVETELGSKMIYLKMRCSGIGSEWGKVTLLGTSGLSGSYIEHRA